MKYEYKSRIRFSECDENKMLSLPGLVNYYQDTCTFQGDDLHVGMDLMQKKGNVWMIAYWQIDIARMPRMSEQVTFATWPYDFKDFYGSRNFTLKDEQGEMISQANSVWVLMDIATQRPVRVPDVLKAAYEIDPRLEMEYTSRKIRMKNEEEAVITLADSFLIERSHLDANHHVNNGQYIALASQYLPENCMIRQMRAEYKMQARLGDRICPRIAVSQDTIQVALNHENGKTFAMVEFAVK